MDTWIYQGGHPILDVDTSGAAVTLRQRQFRYDNTGETLWSVPVILRVCVDGTVTEHRVLMTEADFELDVGGPVEWLVANAGSHGFFRVTYTDELRAALIEQALEILSGPERISLVDDLVASVLAGSTPAIEIVTTAEGFGFEDDLGVWRAIVAGLSVVSRLVEDEAKATFESRVAAVLRGAIDIIGTEPADGEDPLTRELRGLILRSLGTLAGDERARAQSRELMSLYFDDPSSVEPNLAAAAVAVVANDGSDEEFERFVKQFREATTPQEEQRFLFALAMFPERHHIDRVLEMCRTEIRSQNAPFVVGTTIRHREHGSAAWEFLVRNWAELTDRYPENSISRMLGGITSVTDGALATAIAGFVAEHPVPQGAKTIEQHVERMRINVALCAREAEALRELL